MPRPKVDPRVLEAVDKLVGEAGAAATAILGERWKDHERDGLAVWLLAHALAHRAVLATAGAPDSLDDVLLRVRKEFEDAAYAAAPYGGPPAWPRCLPVSV